MHALRHEEFKEGCKAACNGPYDGMWSKTMMGYDSEVGSGMGEAVQQTESLRTGTSCRKRQGKVASGATPLSSALAASDCSAATSPLQDKAFVLELTYK